MTRTDRNNISKRTEKRHLLRRMKSGLAAMKSTPYKGLLLVSYLTGAVLVWLFRAHLFSLDTYGMLSPVLEAVINLLLDRTGRSKEEKERLGQIENRLALIARQGRAFGIHLILATQRPDATIISGQIRNNLDFRVCGRADSVLSQIILDNTSAADQIPKDARGRFLLHDGTVFQGYWFDGERL